MKLQDLDEAVRIVDSILKERVPSDAQTEIEAVNLVTAHYHYLKKRNAELMLALMEREAVFGPTATDDANVQDMRDEYNRRGHGQG